MKKIAEKEIIITEGKFQDFRKSILQNIGIVLKIIFGDKYIIHKFEKEKYMDYEPKHVTKEEYVMNMIESELHEVYNIMTKGYIRVRVGAIEEKRYLTDKYKKYTIENKDEEVEDMDLRVKCETGRAIRNKIVTGTKEKFENKYEVGVITEDGIMTKSEWKNELEKRIVDLKEEHILENLIEYALEECAWIITRENAKEYALDLYTRRIWENEKWVGYDIFRKKLGTEIETKVEEEDVDIEFKNIDSVDVKIITMDDLIKDDMLSVSNMLYNRGYVLKNKDMKLLIRVENDMATVYDDNNKTDLVRFKVNKKRKYSIVGELEQLFKINTSVIEVAEEVIEYVKGFGKINKIKIDIDNIAFLVEGRNEDKYIELVDAMYMTNNTHISKNRVMKEIMNHHVNINEKYEQTEVDYGDFVKFKKNKDSIGVYGGVVERVNYPARTIDVKYKNTSGDIEYLIIPFDYIMRIKTVTIKEIETTSFNEDGTINKKEVSKLVSDVTDISRKCETGDSNYRCIKLIIENLKISHFDRGYTMYGVLDKDRYIEKITKEDIDDDVKSIEKMSSVIIEVTKEKIFNRLRVRGFVIVYYIDSCGNQKRKELVIKEIIENLSKNTKQIDENVVKLNKENTKIKKDVCWHLPIKKNANKHLTKYCNYKE